MAFTSVAPIYDVVMILSSPPLSVKSFSSLMIRLTPLHFMKDTIISIRSADTISFFNSPNSCGSFNLTEETTNEYINSCKDAILKEYAEEKDKEVSKLKSDNASEIQNENTI